MRKFPMIKVEDSVEGWRQAMEESFELLKKGSGVGFDLRGVSDKQRAQAESMTLFFEGERDTMSVPQPKLKNIYKKSLAMALIRLGHDLHHTMRNRENPKYQVFVMVETPELIADMLEWVEQDRMEKQLKGGIIKWD